MRGVFCVSAIMLLSFCAAGQNLPDRQPLPEIEWNDRIITDGVVLKWVQTRLFDSDQAIYIVETDTTAGRFEFGVAAGDKPVITSSYAAGEGVLAAINGTFFNMQEGYNVHFVRVNDSVVAFTDEKEYGIRATGVFTAKGEVVDISAWGPEKEIAGVVTAEDAIVSGPLLTDNGQDIVLDSINFNKNRHPRSLLGITGDGHVLFIAVDGRQPGYADGMSLFELRELARSLGCTEILNLDGGGSTTLYVNSATASIRSDSLVVNSEMANIRSDSLVVNSEMANIRSDSLVVKSEMASIRSDSLVVKSETTGTGSASRYEKGETASVGMFPLTGDGGFADGVVNRPSGKIERPVPSIVFVKKIE